MNSSDNTRDVGSMDLGHGWPTRHLSALTNSPRPCRSDDSH